MSLDNALVSAPCTCRLQEGIALNLEALADYLTRTGPMLGPWDGEATARHELAAQGSSIVLPTLQRSRDKLKSFGPSINHFLAGPAAEIGINLIFQRATDLLIEVIESSEESRKTVSGLLAMALKPEEDPDVRALAALFCGLNGVAKEIVVYDVARVFAQDGDLLVKTAAAAVLHGMAEAPDELKTIADQIVSEVVRDMRPEVFERFSEAGSPQAKIASGIFAMTVMGLVPKLIAERDSPSSPATASTSSDLPASGASSTPADQSSDPSASGASTTAERLRQLDGLRVRKLITDDEYQAKRRAILNSL